LAWQGGSQTAWTLAGHHRFLVILSERREHFNLPQASNNIVWKFPEMTGI
jgi:hypothetical protein